AASPCENQRMSKSEKSGRIESPDPDIREAFALLAAEVEDYIDNLVERETLPDVLLHFTDQAGLMGILQSRKLWASLATALNDASETSVGLDLFNFGERMALTQDAAVKPEGRDLLGGGKTEDLQHCPRSQQIEPAKDLLTQQSSWRIGRGVPHQGD